jgi:hypothetical protein
MVIHFTKTLQESLLCIKSNEHHTFHIHQDKNKTDHSEIIIRKYGDAKWAIIDFLNNKYNINTDLINWLNHKDDDVAYFLSEVGSNSLHHSEFGAPSGFHLWLGEKGFVIAIEQKGKGFNAEHIHQNKIMDNEGAAFDLFRRSKHSIFFDDSINARVVYFEYIM